MQVNSFPYPATAQNYQEALEIGTPRYRSKSCALGHGGVYYTSNRKCVTCSAIQSNASRARDFNDPPNKMVAVDRLHRDMELRKLNASFEFGAML
jgi:hypothetical protein